MSIRNIAKKRCKGKRKNRISCANARDRKGYVKKGRSINSLFFRN